MNMNKMIREIKRDVKNNSAKKITSAMAISFAINPSMLGITRHNKKHIPMSSFDSIIQDLNEYYLDNDFSNHVKVCNENLEYKYDENKETYRSYAYFEIKDLSISIKAIITIDHYEHYLSFEFSELNSKKVIYVLDAGKYQYKDFNIIPREKHIYDMLFHFTMDHYNLYGDEYDDDL